jgi:hypothetical protein
MYNLLNCHNVAKDTEFYLEELWFNVTSTGNARCLRKKRASQLYSKRYCVASVTKTFTLKHFSNARHTVTFGIPYYGIQFAYRLRNFNAFIHKDNAAAILHSIGVLSMCWFWRVSANVI